MKLQVFVSVRLGISSDHELESDHQIHFLKNSFVNKGIDFIGLPSIFNDKATETVPNYFKYTESPIFVINTLYIKPTRNTLFNHDKNTLSY